MNKNKDSSANINNYKFLHELGEGAFGKVTLAIEKKSGNNVAIK